MQSWTQLFGNFNRTVVIVFQLQFDEKLEELKAQKKKILEEVMEKETYKTAKLILERFDPDSKKKNETCKFYRAMQGYSARLIFKYRLHPPGPPLARAILPRERGVMDRVVEFLVGDGPQNRYALVCQQCFSHNGMALKEEFEYVAFRCAYCYFLNPARKTRPQAPRLPDFSFERRPCTDSQTSGVSAEAGVPENQPSAAPLEEGRQECKPVDTDTHPEGEPAERAEDAQASDEKETPQVEEQKPLNAEAEQEEVSFMDTE
ncbi:UNVERIFIED_CONTAM: hypothetical protein FKN15_027270 [Acipenser sinensis]